MMRTLSTKLFALLFAALLFTGCGGSSEAPAVEENDAIVIEAGDQLQFSVTGFTAAAGSNVHIMLKNVGSLPKETFGHNIVFLTAGADLQAFGQAAVSAADNEYIPADMADWVLAAHCLALAKKPWLCSRLRPSLERTSSFAPSQVTTAPCMAL
ncbi:MAG: hypothetical protein O3A57_09715 [Bacteroidetes bacterium]|nr:hypothetical protein [Bacteroidota bacterium]